MFCFRDEFGQWDPKQRPELWNLYNGRHHKGEHIRVFPMSNWTELDVWSYIAAENNRTAAAVLRAPAQVFERDGMLLAVNRHHAAHAPMRRCSRPRCGSAPSAMPPAPGAWNRRQHGVGGHRRDAVSRMTERGATRADDRISEAGMEDRKRQGYF